MSIEIITISAIILGALVLFITGWIPMEITAICVLVSLVVTGILSPEEGFSGFSSSATLTVMALLIISEALKNTGVVEALGEKLIVISGDKEWKAILTIMLFSAVTSAFINTTAVVAVFIPVVLKISRVKSIHSSVLLIPLSFAAMLGGASTMFGTSTNLLINAVGQANGLDKFQIFELTPFGLILLAVLFLFMVFVGRFILRKNKKPIEIFDHSRDAKTFLTEFVVSEESKLIGQKIGDTPIFKNFEVTIYKINDKYIQSEHKEEIVTVGNKFLVKTNLKEIIRLNNEGLLISTNFDKRKIEEGDHIQLVESLVMPNSNLIGQRIRFVDFYRLYGAFPLALRRGAGSYQREFGQHRIQSGDILLMEGSGQGKLGAGRRDFTIVDTVSRKEINKEIPIPKKMGLSILIVLVVIGLAVSNYLPILVSAWLGVILIFVTGCIRLNEAYRNIDWRVIFLLAGVIPLGMSLQKVGGDTYIAQMLVSVLQGADIHLVIGVFFLFTTLITSVLSNQATAVLLVPIAISVAAAADLPPELLVISILFGANSSFITPVGYQTNAMVYAAGDYTFMDFFKVGWILSLIMAVIAAFGLPWMFGA